MVWRFWDVSKIKKLLRVGGFGDGDAELLYLDGGHIAQLQNRLQHLLY
jgi:hypothetical protein